MRSYLDFDLEIGKSTIRQEYPVRVLQAEGGVARGMMRFPYDSWQLETQLLKLEKALLQATGKRRVALTEEEQAVQEFGKNLFDSLLTNEVRACYRRTVQRAHDQDKGVRVRLHIQAPEMAALPWEFLYDPDRHEYLCLSSNTPIIRFPELSQMMEPLEVALPLRILGMVASPKGLEPLDVAQEKEQLTRALSGLIQQGVVQLHWVAGQSWRVLQRTLGSSQGPWHIFHFIGHGGYDPYRDEGFLALADERGQPSDIPATEFARLVADHRSLRLVVLNACEGGKGGVQDIFSSTASILTGQGVPAVLAMQYPILDETAIRLSQYFYEELAEGLPVEEALAETRKALSIGRRNSPEWGVPMLSMRAKDGQLFRWVDSPKPPTPLPPPIPTHDPKMPVVPPPEEGIPSELHQAVIEALLKLEALKSDETLRAMFIDSRLFLWRDQIPQAPSKSERTEKLIAFLWEKFRQDGKNGLAIFLRRAAEGMAAQDLHRNTLEKLAGQVEGAVHPPKMRRGQPPKPVESQRTAQGLFWKPPHGEPDWGVIPAGEFWMGSEKGRDNEKPMHRVYLDAFWIARTPITNAQYQLFVQAAKYKPPAHWQNGQIPSGKENHPVVWVSWHDAQEYARWLAGVTKRSVALPTEAQWERAARGAVDQRDYPWKGSFDKNRANAQESGVRDTTPVDRYPLGASPEGVLDMAGNVWEWTSSPYQPYPYLAAKGDSSMYVLRGGSFYGSSSWLRCAYRHGNSPDNDDNYLGFRVVVSPFPSHL